MKFESVSFGVLWLVILEINAQITLESVYRKVNDLEVEVTALKVNFMTQMSRIERAEGLNHKQNVVSKLRIKMLS